MNHDAYSEFVGALASKERHTHLVPHRLFRLIATQALYDQEQLDALKKALFAGKHNHSLEATRKSYAMAPEAEDYPGVNMDLLHGILGLRTEADELLRLTVDARSYKTIDPQKVVDEAGDALFYIALQLRAVGKTLDDALDGNVAKLKVRYPEGYNSAVAAAEKNRDAEAAAQAAVI
jgi:NTP pyrophosphatase (non-canonical NTP hydrolase)